MFLRPVSLLKPGVLVNIAAHEKDEHHWLIKGVSQNGNVFKLNMFQAAEGRTVDLDVFGDDLIEVVFG